MLKYLLICVGIFSCVSIVNAGGVDSLRTTKNIVVSDSGTMIWTKPVAEDDLLIDTAKTYIGCKYKYGAKGPKRFDCSGFTKYIFSMFGYDLPASSSEMFNVGTRVSRDSLHKGDLVFFRRGRRAIGHVGIVVSADSNGDFEMIHASSSKGITIDRVHPDGYYFHSRYAGAVRVLSVTSYDMNREFMKMAIEASETNMNENGGPFGAVIVKGNEIIAVAGNRVTANNDPTAHAEIMAIRAACKKLGTFDLSGCDIYSSCEPCPMCLGAIYWAHLDGLYYAGTKRDAADAGFDDSFIYEELDKPQEERRLKSENTMREAAVEVFNKWIKKSDKIDY